MHALQTQPRDHMAKVSDLRVIPGRVPPSDLDAEAAVLSAIFLEGFVPAAVSDILEPAHFYADANRRIYEEALALQRGGRPVDIVAVSGVLRDKGRLDQIGGSPYLAQLTDATPAVAHVAAHAAVVREKWRLRHLISVCQQFAADGYGDIGEVQPFLDRASSSLRELAGDASAGSGFTATNAAAIFAPLEPVRYVIEGLDLCAGAPAMAAGYGFSGKTLALQSAALTIASGVGKVWGCFAAPRGRVLHLDYEQGSRLTRERYQRLAVPMMIGPSDLGDRLALVTMPGRYLDGPAAESDLERLVTGYTFVIVDSLRAAAPTVDENSSDVRRVLDLMGRVSEKTGAAFVVIHHARKPNAAQVGGAKMAIRGSGALFDACSSVLVFEAEKGEPVRVSQEKARSRGTLSDDFELEIGDVPDGHNPRAGLFVSASAAPSREVRSEESIRSARLAKTAQIQDQLRGLFRSQPELGGADTIATKLGRAKADVRSALAAMVEDGEVERTGSTKNLRHRWLGRE